MAGTYSAAAADAGIELGFGERFAAYQQRKPQTVAILALVLFLIPLLIFFVGWFAWAISEFFEPEPSYDYFFWLGLIVGGGSIVFVAAAIRDLWVKRIWTSN